jgi:hypothetical protein
MRRFRNLVTLTVAIAALSPGAASAGRGRAVSDGILRLPLPTGWDGSVGQGWQGSHPIAWILAGDFHLRAGAARREGGPGVPRSKLLLTIGDFFPAASSARWPVVNTLRMPHGLIRAGHWWRIRYERRALAIKVTFGSPPSHRLVLHVEKVLASVRR